MLDQCEYINGTSLDVPNHNWNCNPKKLDISNKIKVRAKAIAKNLYPSLCSLGNKKSVIFILVFLC